MKLVIDGPYLAHRSYHAPYRLVSSTGLDGTMFHSFVRTINSLRKKYKPEQVIVAWESHGTESWRRKLYNRYKPMTHGKTEIFWQGIKDIQLFLYLLGIKQYYSPTNEADDVIATIANNGNKDLLIFTTDKDMMQLVNSNCRLCDGEKIMEYDDVVAKYSVTPEQIPDLLAIWGDKADNIEGIVGYGVKKASDVVNKYGCIENIDKNCTLAKYLNHMMFNKKLTTLNDKCVLMSIPNDEFSTNETLESMLDKYEFQKMKDEIEDIKLISGGIDKWIN